MTTLKQFAIELPAIKDEAKVLWGEEDSYSDLMGTIITAKVWQEHLVSMVLSDDPVKYFKEHLNEQSRT